MKSNPLTDLPIRIVLVGTTHPGNIGASARAMKTMGLSQLYLVDPRHFPHADATAMASGADDLLANATVTATLEEALADCGYCLGASARMRSLAWPVELPAQAAQKARAEAQKHPVALIFGRERTGLTNDELALCHGLVNIPANPDYQSLNLAMAVQVLCYELLMSTTPELPEVTEDERAATSAEMEHFYTHLQQVMIDTDFLDPSAPKHLMRRLRRLFGRARPNINELNILRGILKAVEPHD